jgi:hypothetical protein
MMKRCRLFRNLYCLIMQSLTLLIGFATLQMNPHQLSVFITTFCVTVIKYSDLFKFRDTDLSAKEVVKQEWSLISWIELECRC